MAIYAKLLDFLSIKVVGAENDIPQIPDGISWHLPKENRAKKYKSDARKDLYILSSEGGLPN